MTAFELRLFLIAFGVGWPLLALLDAAGIPTLP